MILCPDLMKAAGEEKKAAAVCLDHVALNTDLYRLGHTKARKKAHFRKRRSLGDPYTVATARMELDF